MSNDTQRTIRFLKGWAINTLAVLVAVNAVRGISVSSPYAAPILTALVLSILNEFVRPILMILALPLLLFTLGLFTFVINALLLCFVAWLLPNVFHVNTFGAAFLGALVISIITTLLNIMTGGTKVQVRRGPPSGPPDRPGSSGGGPVIDV